MKRVWAFTLVELLVVIAIVGLLMALLLPAISRCKHKAQAIHCRNNLRQWGLAMQLYVAANNDKLPPDGFATPVTPGHFVSGWYVQLPKVLALPPYQEMPWRTNDTIDPGRSVWICPANTRRSDGRLLFHYCLNRNANGIGTGSEAKIHSIRNPAAVVWLFDNGKVAAVAQQNNVHTNVHNRGAQFVFVDGHVEGFRNTDYWDFRAGRGITNNPQLVWRF